MGDQVPSFKKHVMCKNPTLKNALKTLSTINRYWFGVGDYAEQWVTTVACFWIQMYPKTEENIKLVDKYIIPYENDVYNVDDRKELILKMLETKTFSMQLIYDYINSEQPCHGEEIIIVIIMQHIHLCSDYYSDEDIKTIIKEFLIPSIKGMEKYLDNTIVHYRYKVGLELIIKTATLNKQQKKIAISTDNRLNNNLLLSEAVKMCTMFTSAYEFAKRSKRSTS